MEPDDRIEPEQMGALNAAFGEMLMPCLEECARGRRGLFGAGAAESEGKSGEWAEAERVREFAVRIQQVLAQAGERSALVDEFLDLCTIHGEHDPGEARLAREFLKRIGKGEVGTPTQQETNRW
jgi:hypothetical protein